jgi:hypothetical protein
MRAIAETSTRKGEVRKKVWKEAPPINCRRGSQRYNREENVTAEYLCYLIVFSRVSLFQRFLPPLP